MCIIPIWFSEEKKTIIIPCTWENYSRVSYLGWLKMEKGKVLLEWRKSFIPRIAFKMRKRWVFEPHWMGGFHLAVIGRGMNRWIFSSSSLVLRVNMIVDWWKLNKEGFHFILIGQGQETFTFWRRKAPWRSWKILRFFFPSKFWCFLV